MKSLSKLVSAILLLVLVLAAFPAVGASTAQAQTCDWAQFVADVTVPDGSTYAANATFTKTWRLKNIGTCTWTTNYAIVFDSGSQMGAPASQTFQTNVAPGQTIDLTLNMTAPNAAGHYFGYYKLQNAAGTRFGIGRTANSVFWVEINVGGTTGSGYDFTANAASAVWSSGAGTLTFPGTDGDARGFALRQDNPTFEGNYSLGAAGLLVSPQNLYNGYIQATYPAIRIQTGDRFLATVGCELNATSCYVAYRLDYQIGTGPIRTFWSFREKHEGLTYPANLNLNSLAGYDVKFTLFMSAYGSATGDRAIWGNPIITRAGATPATAIPTVTGTPPTPTFTSTAPTSPPTVSPTSCDKAQFVRDVTVPDGTTFAAGTAFDKTWELKNVGTCTWTTAYKLFFSSGSQMGGPNEVVFTQSVAPGQSVRLTVRLTAPNTAGNYRGYWMFKNANNELFGIRILSRGPYYNQPWWVDINVTGSSGVTTTPTQTGTTTLTPTATGTATQTPTSTATPTATNTP